MPPARTRTRPRARPQRRLLLMLAAICAGSAISLAWLSWDLIRRDRTVEAQRDQEALEASADRVVQAFERRIGEAEARLTAALDRGTIEPDPADPGVTVVFSPDQVTTSRPLVFVPVAPAPRDPDPSRFSTALAAEYQDRNSVRAQAEYRRLAASADEVVKSTALLGLARVLRNGGRLDEARVVYEQLAGLEGTRVIGLPADLIGRDGEMELLQELGRADEARSAGRELVSALSVGKWTLARGQYEHYAERAARTAGVGLPETGLPMADGVERLWRQWVAGSAPRGRQLQRSGDRWQFVSWRSSSERFAAWLVDPNQLVPTLGLDPSIVVALSDADAGASVTGSGIPEGRKAVRTTADSRLPFTLYASRNGDATEARLATRATIVVSGLAFMLLFLGAGAYFIGRAIQKEAALSQAQTDFVAAVSHEFRTPLASLRQLSELLAAGRVPTDDKKQHYYEAMATESRRLQRLVENLLNVGRMEARTTQYELAPIEARALVEHVVSEYQSQLAKPDCPIEFDGSDDTTMVMADRDAAALALHNLLDNAVKYSGGAQPVRIDWTRQGDRIAFGVHDQGPGLAADEQHRIFDKFVRGTAARSGNVRGTGVGLAMVRIVAEGHGGDVTVDSQPGAGATFTLSLPAARVAEGRP